VLLARGLGRRRLHLAAERLLAELQRRLPDEVCLALQRARLLEWSLRQPAAAHAVVSDALARLPPEDSHRTELERRLVRLERRLAGAWRRDARHPVQPVLFPGEW
jgi:hypothetical protein